MIEAAGALVWRKGSSGLEVAVIHRPKYDDWALPKGKLKKDETWEAGAVREIKEETGCDVELESFAGSTCYLVGDRPKIVLYWNARLIKERKFKANGEVDRMDWLTVKQALKRIDYEDEKDLLLKASNS